jgi:hypothetical protein
MDIKRLRLTIDPAATRRARAKSHLAVTTIIMSEEDACFLALYTAAYPRRCAELLAVVRPLFLLTCL